jgi:hypothetical protein
MKEPAVFNSFFIRQPGRKFEISHLTNILTKTRTGNRNTFPGSAACHLGIRFIKMSHELEDLFNQKVDLVSRRAIKPRYLPFVEKSLIHV